MVLFQGGRRNLLCEVNEISVNYFYVNTFAMEDNILKIFIIQTCKISIGQCGCQINIS